MSEQEIIQQLKKIPTEAQKEAADFVEFLYNKYTQQSDQDTPPKKSILDSPFRGMWKDREDMKDSTAWVRNIRKSQWGE